MVSLKDGLIETDLYTKPTDKHQYLLISSCHPTHTKRSIPYSLALRLRRICSDNDTYKQRCKELMDYLVNRGYELSFLKTQIRRASDISRNDALKPKPKQQTDTVPFVIKPRSHIWLSGFLICLRFVFFSFVCEQTRTPTRPIVMMSSSANERPFLSSFRHIPPQESFVQLTNLTIQTKNGRRGERLIWSNLG